jgi:hypothetical protein
MSPPEFYGEYNPAKAREWIQRMSGILESMDCTEADKVVMSPASLGATLVTGGMERRRIWRPVKWK